MRSVKIPTQPMPEHVAEACAWLSAAERYTGPDQQLRERLDAGDVLDILCDIQPPYAPIDTTRPAVPLVEAAPRIVRALENAIGAANTIEEKLRVARALGALRRERA